MVHLHPLFETDVNGISFFRFSHIFYDAGKKTFGLRGLRFVSLPSVFSERGVH